MAVEIERKFLVRSDAWRREARRAQRMVQGYLIDADVVRSGKTLCSARVRIAGENAWLNIKSADLGIARQEFDYAIPVADAEQLLARLCRGTVEKTRHYVPYGGLEFEVDEFAGANAGLVVAELELGAIDQPFERPDWLGDEVTAAPRYYNLNLIQHPYSAWSRDEREGTC